MSPWYLLGGFGLAAGIVWLVYRSTSDKTESEPGKDVGGGEPFLAAGGTEAETAKALTALGALPVEWAKKAEEALLSGDAKAMEGAADTFEKAADDYAPGEPVGAALDNAAKILRGRALAIRALGATKSGSAGFAPSFARIPSLPSSPSSVFAEDPRSDWTERFPYTAAATEGQPSIEGLFGNVGDLHAQAKGILEGLYVVGGETYFVGDPRTVAGSMMVDYASALPEGWSADGAIEGLYLPTVSDVRMLQEALPIPEVSEELGEVLAGMQGFQEFHGTAPLPAHSAYPMLPEYASQDLFAQGGAPSMLIEALRIAMGGAAA